MAITVTMYKNFSKKYNSTKQPSAGDSYTDFSCNIKDNTSVLDPVLDLVMTGTNPLVTSPVDAGYNYAYIAKWNRYYFITDWRYNKGLWIASLSIDVLASYKTGIGNLSKYILRSSSDYDLDVIDTKYPTTAPATLSYAKGDNPYRQTTGCYIIGLIGESQGGAPSIGGINYYCMTQSQMSEFITYLTSSSWATQLADDDAGLTENVVKSLVNPLDYIESCIWLPFEIALNTAGTKIQPKLGWWNSINFIKNGYPGDSTKWGLTPMYYGSAMSDVIVQPSASITWTNTITIPDHPNASRGNWLNGAPFSYYTLHLDPWGDMPLDPQIIMNNKTLTLKIRVEIISGIGVLEVTSSSGLILRKTAPLGVPISIAQIITDYSSAFTKTGVLAGGAAGLLSGGNLKKLWQGIMQTNAATDAEAAVDAVKTLGQGIKGTSSDIMSGIAAYNSEMTSTGISGSLASYIYSTLTSGGTNLYTNGAYVKIVRFNPVVDDPQEFGRPCCNIKTISTLSGYVECADGEHNIAALASEKSMISRFLTGGFFYE